MNSERYFAVETPDAPELARLECLSHVYDPVTTRRLTTLGVAAGWRCLEVGAGAGSIARWLSDRVGPEGVVVAADLNPRFLHASQRPNLEVRRHDILGDELESGRYDLVHCRALLMHLPDPAAALARMAAAVRPGGWLAIEESDMTSFAAAEPGHARAASFDRVSRAITTAMHASGAMDCYFGRRVRARRAAGLDRRRPRRRRLRASRRRTGRPLLPSHARLVADKLLAARVLTAADCDENFAAYDDATFSFGGMTLFGAWARREA